MDRFVSTFAVGQSELNRSVQAILATIHQPSAELFQVFDRLILLKKGGEVVYQGEIGENSKTLIKYFEGNSEMKCGPKDNPAEYILDVIGAGASAKTSPFCSLLSLS